MTGAQPPDELTVVDCKPAKGAFCDPPLGKESLNLDEKVILDGHKGRLDGRPPICQWDTSPLPPAVKLWDASHMNEAHLVANVRRRMEALHMNPKSLSIASGLNETYVRDLLKGRSRNPRTEHLEKLAKGLGCTIADLTGPIGASVTRVRSIATEPDLPDTVPEPGVAVDEFGPKAGMGAVGLDDDERKVANWRFPSSWLQHELRVDPKQLAILTVEGDSMDGTLAPGDKVIIDQGRRAPSPPGLFLVHDGIGLVAKRLEYIEGSEPPKVRIISDNLRYKPYERLMDEINIVGRIMARWERLS